jgi:hypothetical protein
MTLFNLEKRADSNEWLSSSPDFTRVLASLGWVREYESAVCKVKKEIHASADNHSAI